jgi:LysR family hydrogen peroxide-inducible transcriptional activator
MKLQQLHYFVAVAEEKNFTRASSACRVAQPALSQQIRKLEDELGLPLFERNGRGVTLTPAGEVFLAYAGNVLQLLSEGKRRLVDMREFRLGVVTVLCPPTLATYWLPKVISRFRYRYPDVEIRILEKSGCSSRDMASTVADLGVVQVEGEEPSGGALNVEPLFADEQVVVFPIGHALSTVGGGSTTPVPMSALAGEPLILPKAPCGLSRVFSRAFAEAGLQPRVAMETTQVEAIYEMVAAGLGIGLTPRMAIHRTYNGIHWRPLERPVPARTIGLAWFPDRPLSSAANAFANALREESFETSKVALHAGASLPKKVRKTAPLARALATTR